MKRHPLKYLTLRPPGFTLIELLSVILIISLLAAVGLPRFVNINSAAKVATLNTIAGSMQSTLTLVKVTAISQGITPESSVAMGESARIVDFNGKSTEVTAPGLCLESIAELGDALSMIDFIDVSEAGGLRYERNNKHTLIGYDISPTASSYQGCYIIYNSFADGCDITVVTADC